MAVPADLHQQLFIRQLQLEDEQRIAFAKRHGYAILACRTPEPGYEVISDHVVATCQRLHDAAMIAVALVTYRAVGDLLDLKVSA